MSCAIAASFAGGAADLCVRLSARKPRTAAISTTSASVAARLTGRRSIGQPESSNDPPLGFDGVAGAGDGAGVGAGDGGAGPLTGIGGPVSNPPRFAVVVVVAGVAVGGAAGRGAGALGFGTSSAGSAGSLPSWAMLSVVPDVDWSSDETAALSLRALRASANAPPKASATTRRSRSARRCLSSSRGTIVIPRVSRSPRRACPSLIPMDM
jgi:hypothetical protein